MIRIYYSSCPDEDIFGLYPRRVPKLVPEKDKPPCSECKKESVANFRRFLGNGKWISEPRCREHLPDSIKFPEKRNKWLRTGL
jgi:hypothetical protein